MTTMSVAFAPRPEDEIKYYGQVDNSHRSIHDPTLYPEQPEAAGVRTATFLKKSGNVWYLMRVSLVMGDRVRAFTFWKTFASFVQLHQDLLGSMPLLPLPHLPPLYYFDSYRTRDQETIDLRLNAITGLMDHLARAHLSTEARGIVEKFLLEAEEGSNEFHPRLVELLKVEVEIQHRVQRQQQQAARVAASLERLQGQHRHLEALVHQRSQYLQQLNEREAIVTTREGAVADREAALQGRSDRVAAREAACRVSEAQAVERKAYFQGLKPETDRLEAEIASLRHTTAELQSIHDGWKKRVAEERAKVAVCIEQANLRTQEFQGELVARERELSSREARMLNKEVLLGTLAEEYRKARQRMPGLPALPANFRALTNG